MYAGADWLENSLGKTCSPFGRKVANILGAVWLGLYHINHGILERTEWNQEYIEINISENLSTYDGDYLTALVVLCHDAAIRLEINACNMRYVKLRFHPRTHDMTHYMSRRHPTLEQAAAQIRQTRLTGD